MNNLQKFSGIEKLRSFSKNDLEKSILEKLRFDIQEIRKNGAYIFGTGKLGRKINKFFLNNSIPVLGYIDNNKNNHGKTADNCLIKGPDTLQLNSIVYVASETYVNPLCEQLKNLGITKTITHFQGSVLFKDLPDFPNEPHFQNLLGDLIDHKGKYLSVFERLSDEKSRVVFDSLIHYRITGDLAHIDSISEDPQLEYFDKDLVKITDREVFFDCGGFDGDSAANFIKFVNKQYASIHIFEPDKTLLEKAKTRLTSNKNIFYNLLGVYNQSATFRFDKTGDSDGVISSSGEIEIETVNLDSYSSNDHPTYIKLDIEGVEIEAIDGAKNTIKKHSPKLAVAAYHYPKHFWEIPNHILEISDNYTLHLRHYSNCIFGSTYYFIPKK